MSDPGWTRPADIATQVQRHWDQGRLLRDSLKIDRADYPLRLRFRKPTSKELAEDFNRVRDWIAELEAGSRESRGFGYTIEWKSVRHRVHGSNDLPSAIVIPSLQDAVRLIGKQRDLASFERLVADCLADFPDLADWFKTFPLRALQHRADWPRLCAVLDYFRARPRPGLYLRQLEIPGVDSKFIETHRGLISEWLDLILPDSAIDTSAAGSRGFNRRYGLRDKPALVRFRILDPTRTVAGLDDLSVPAEQFADLSLSADTVFITENEINGLAFPAWPGGIVIFGLGYGLDRLARISWLKGTRVIYWGDIDTHGFAILNRLRHYLPDADSLLMDRATLEQHRALWGQEPKQRRFLGQLDRLNAEENALFEDLRDNVLGERVRLEQERIDFGWVLQSISPES